MSLYVRIFLETLILYNFSITFNVIRRSNSTMLSVSDKYDSVNERTHEISELMKLHILGVWQNAHEIY